MFVDTDPGSLPGSIIHFNRLLNDIAISQILGNESAQRPLKFVIRFMSKLRLKIRWTSTDEPGAIFRLEVSYQASRRHLPIVTLKRAA